MTTPTLRGAFAALALVLLATPALAQSTSPNADPSRSAEHQRMHEMMEQHRAAQAQDLRTILHLRPDQTAAFTAFQASMTPPPHDHDGWDHDKMAAMTTPQRLDMMLARMDERSAHMRAHVQATKTFYAALSPEQQQVFDALMRMHGMHGGHGRHEHGHWGGHGDMGGPEGSPPPPPGA